MLICNTITTKCFFYSIIKTLNRNILSIFSVLFFLCFHEIVFCQAPIFNFAVGVGANSFDEALSTVSDSNGNSYTAGYFSGTVDFNPSVTGTYNLSASGTTDIFIQKIDATGAFVWAYKFGSAFADRCNAIALDHAGSIYITGFFNGSANFTTATNTTTLISSGAQDIFIAKLDTTGNLLYANKVGDTGNESANAIAIDTTNNVIITGSFMGAVNFNTSAGSTILSSVGYSDIFIAKYNAAGLLLWAKSEGSTGIDAANAVCTTTLGNIYATGYFSDIANFNKDMGVFNLQSAGGIDIFIQKFDANGNFLWAKNIGGSGAEEALGIATDKLENVYTTGRFDSVVDFDPSNNMYNLTSNGNSDIFIQKLDANGQLIFAKSIGSIYSDAATAITISNNKDIFFTGYFSGNANFNSSTNSFVQNSSGLRDLFIERLDTAGNFLWATTVGSIGNDKANSITTNTNSKLITSGYFGNTVDFDYSLNQSNITSNGSVDFFVQALDNCMAADLPILLYNISPICVGDTAKLFISSGSLNSATHWQWYSGACGQNPQGIGDTIYVSPNTSTNYYARGEGGCTSPNNCAVISLNVNAKSIWYKDEDSDGYFSDSAIQCEVPIGNGWSVLPQNGSGDCNDNNALINPGVVEICGNGIDDNCNNQIDEGCLMINISAGTIACNADSATITATVQNGTLPYTYSINGSSYNSSNIFNVPAGTFIIIGKDSFNNTATSNPITIVEPPAITIIFSIINVSCFGGSDGMIIIHASGGTPPYQYSFDNGVTYQSDSVKVNLAAGFSTTVWVKDANSCKLQQAGNILITQPTRLGILGTCYLPANKVLGVQAKGGTTPYTFSLNGTTYISGNQRNGNAKTWTSKLPGIYTIYIKDSKNCIYNKLVKTDTLPACPSSSPLVFTKQRGDNSQAMSRNFMASVYPNPSAAGFIITVSGNTGEPLSIRVLDVAGRIIYTAFGNNNTFYFGEKFVPGVYIAEARSGNNSTRIKIIKQ